MSIPAERDWSEFYQATLNRALHPHYENIDPHLPAGGDALDLGCGVGRGVLHLVEKGFRVTAVDKEQEAIDHLHSIMPKGAPIKTVVSGFEDLQLETYDVVIAQFSLFFLSPPAFDAFWTRLLKAIRPGGLLSMQLLGTRDEWKDHGYTMHTREQVDELLKPFDVLFLDEVERDGETAVGTKKHWHVFHIVARKR